MEPVPASHRGWDEYACADRTDVEGYPIRVRNGRGEATLYSNEVDAAFDLAVECYPRIADGMDGREMLGAVRPCDDDGRGWARLATVYCRSSRFGGIEDSEIECSYDPSYESTRFLRILGDLVRTFLGSPMPPDYARDAAMGSGVFREGRWSLSRDDVGALRDCVARHVRSASASDPHVCSMGMRVLEPRVETSDDGFVLSARIRVSGDYFEDREAVTLCRDGFIGIAGWADSRNAGPFAEAVAEWAEARS